MSAFQTEITSSCIQ